MPQVPQESGGTCGALQRGSSRTADRCSLGDSGAQGGAGGCKEAEDGGGRCPDMGQQQLHPRGAKVETEGRRVGSLREGPGLEVVRVNVGVLGPPEVLTLP